MRSIVHEILARYLESDQFAFGASSWELWLWERTPAIPQAGAANSDRALDQWENEGGNREPEPQS